MQLDADSGAPVGLRCRLFAGMQLTCSLELQASSKATYEPIASVLLELRLARFSASLILTMDGGAWEEEEADL